MVKVLYEQNLLPRVMAGSSVGSIVAAIICTRTDAELASVFARLELFDFSFFNNSRAMEMVNQLVNKGAFNGVTWRCFDAHELCSFSRKTCTVGGADCSADKVISCATSGEPMTSTAAAL